MRLRTTLLIAAFFLTLGAGMARGQESPTLYNVTFQLDARNLLDACQLGPKSSATVDLRGSFNAWNGDETPATDPDADGIYTATVQLAAGAYEFKFYHSKFTWPEGDNFTVTVASDTVVAPVVYNKTFDSVCGSVERCVDVMFQVNMQAQIASGSWDPATNLVVVAGPFNGWNSTADTLQPSFLLQDVYFKLMNFQNQPVPGRIEHKFVSGTLGTSPSGWEAFGGNRYLEVTGQEPDLDGNGCLDVEATEIPYFSNITLADLLSQETTLYLEVDARPAYYFLADSTYVPGTPANLAIDRLDGFSKLFLNGPLSGSWADEWGPEGLGTITDRMLYDDGTHGDRVAGDSVFTFRKVVPAGTARVQVFKLGLDAYDNENPSGADHHIVFPDAAESRVRVVFGAARRSDGTYAVDFYAPYIDVTAEGPVVARDRSTAVEPVGADVPTTVTLGQNYPNPFNPSTSFEYTLGRTEHVRVRVFDATGRVVATLVDGVQTAHTYRVTFDARDLPSGIYLYQVATPSRTIARTMVLVK